jgi:AcrR family transcriptional regulator
MTSPEAPIRTLTKRGQRTRALLVDASRTIFERDGFAAARITDIADEAGVAHGTFYSYFDSKEEIFRELVVLVRDELARGARTPLDELPALERGDSPRASVARANRRYLAAYSANRRLMVIWEQAATLNAEFQVMLTESREQFTRRSEAWIRELQEAGAADRAIDPYYAAVALGAMVSRFAYIWFAGGQDFDVDRAVEQLTLIWCNALAIVAD